MTTLSTPPPALEVRGLRKSFGELTVLDGIDLTVPRGTVLALLGPNGAGKTTAVSILSTLIRADAGTATVAGHDVRSQAQRVRARIGVTGQFSAVDGLLSPRENLDLMARLHHLPRAVARQRIDDLLTQFELTEAAGKPSSMLSGGMRRRLDLAMTLVGDPEVVFLDEPTTGLDPRSRRAVWDVVRGLAASGVTILLTTQYLEEADQLADRVVVLDGGRIVAEGTPSELKRALPGGTVRVRLAVDADLGAAARALPDATAEEDGTVLVLESGSDVASLRDVLDRLDAAGITEAHLDVTTPDLDDVFLSLTGPAGTRPTAEKAS